jgi:hypothetical protein
VTSISYRIVTTTASIPTKSTNAAAATATTKYYSTIPKHSATISSTICKIQKYPKSLISKQKLQQ